MRTPVPILVSVLLSVLLLPLPLCQAAENGGDSLEVQAAASLREAVGFFTREVSTEGGYLWQYSADLAYREGEGRADDATVWVQPPGTPSVGEAILDAYEATGETDYLEAARKTGMCLVRGQLVSGGWGYSIHFRPEARKRHAYRVDAVESESPRGANTSTLDDDTTQAALRFLMRLDRALDFRDRAIHEAALYGLDRLLAAQYPNGAWPQRFTGPPNPEDFPVRKAAYPASWPREHPRAAYGGFYTLNDNTHADVMSTMLLASSVYTDIRYRDAAVRGAEFLILAQMPDPQPAWAQQYDAEMHPAWARRFEPPAVTGGESHGAMCALMEVCRATGERRFLEPIPRAIAYLRGSLLPDGRLARFYELETNRPLYFTKDYRLTYDDGDMPTHYAFKTASGLDVLEREYHRLAGLSDENLAALPDQAARRSTARGRSSSRPSQAQVQAAQRAIAALDARGCWIETGRMQCFGDVPVDRVVRTSTFIRHVRVLASYLAAQRGS